HRKDLRADAGSIGRGGETLVTLLWKNENGRNKYERDQSGRECEPLHYFPTVQNPGTAILQLRRECTDTRARSRFGGEHRHERRNKAPWNTCCLQLFDRQSLRVLVRANLFDGGVFERPVA